MGIKEINGKKRSDGIQKRRRRKKILKARALRKDKLFNNSEMKTVNRIKTGTERRF